MSFREDYGGMVEAALNAAVDANLDGDKIKAMLHEQVDKLVDEQLTKVKAMIKEAIDKIDGEVG